MVVVAIAASWGLGAPAGAGDGTADGGSIAPAAFVNGTALAEASTAALGIGAGSINIGWRVGTAEAALTQSSASAEATVADVRSWMLFFGPDAACGDRPPIWSRQQIPPRTFVSSSTPNGEQSREVQTRWPVQDPEVGPIAGKQNARAGKQPYSVATTAAEPIDFILYQLEGGKSEARTRVSDGSREAVATVTGDRLIVLGGVFVFEQPRWHAVARSGGEQRLEGDFSFARATILGIPVDGATAATGFKEFAYHAGQILGPLGIRLEFPKVTVTPPGGDAGDDYEGRVEISPMALYLENPPLGRDVFLPLWNSFAPEWERFKEEAIAEDCNAAKAATVIDTIALGLTGQGLIRMEIGGVDVETTSTPPPAPLDPIPRPQPPTTAPAVTTPPTTAPVPTTAPISGGGGGFDGGTNYNTGGEFDGSSYDDFDGSGYDDFDSSFTGTDSLPFADDGGDGGVVEGVSETLDPSDTEPVSSETAAPRVTPIGKRGGAALAVGLAGVVLALGLAMADRTVVRRGTRRIA